MCAESEILVYCLFQVQRSLLWQEADSLFCFAWILPDVDTIYGYLSFGLAQYTTEYIHGSGFPGAIEPSNPSIPFLLISKPISFTAHCWLYRWDRFSSFTIVCCMDTLGYGISQVER